VGSDATITHDRGRFVAADPSLAFGTRLHTHGQAVRWGRRWPDVEVLLATPAEIRS